MRYVTLVAVVVVSLLGGCSSRQVALLPPDTDRQELLATIARTMKDPTPDHLEKPPTGVTFGDCVKTAGMVGVVAAYIIVCIPFLIASKGSSGSFTPSFPSSLKDFLSE